MGHDITALKNYINEDVMRAEYNLNRQDSGWLDRYRRYRRTVEVAYNRRAAGNPLNQVLYLALGVVDEAYAGCSGNGSELDFTLDQLRTAREILDCKNFANMEREENLIDSIVGLLATSGATVIDCRDPDDVDISQEKQFLDKCISYLEDNEESSIRIVFG